MERIILKDVCSRISLRIPIVFSECFNNFFTNVQSRLKLNDSKQFIAFSKFFLLVRPFISENRNGNFLVDLRNLVSSI